MRALAKTLALGIVVTDLAVGLAAAASLGVGSAGLSAGNAPVTSCGVSSLTATRTVDNSGNVTQVNVSGIPSGCVGETLAVTLMGTNVSAATTVAGSTATLSGFGSVAASSVSGYAFAVEGA